MGQPGPASGGAAPLTASQQRGHRPTTAKAVSKHAAGIFGKLDLAPSDDDNRRVLAVLAYLDS